MNDVQMAALKNIPARKIVGSPAGLMRRARSWRRTVAVIGTLAAWCLPMALSPAKIVGAARTDADSVAAPPRYPLLGDRGLSGMAAQIHLIDLIDGIGEKILQNDELPFPFSTRQTCSPCHDYATISMGWHFSGGKPHVDAGRRGQPWIYVDSLLGLQLPLSNRNWPGVTRPADVGLSRWDFLARFGGLMPGGWSEDSSPESAGYNLSWLTSGEPEVNCLACHDRSFKQNRAEYHSQMSKGNFAWATTAASGLADVQGSIENLPPLYDPYLPRPLDDRNQNPPKIRFRPAVFNDRNKVELNLSRRINNESCLACHSSLYASSGSLDFEPLHTDIHMSAGMQCVDCHDNGIDHLILRGYEGEKGGRETASCRGCHLSRADAVEPAGDFGAPDPAHGGLPASHLERFSCTSCHSGPLPEAEPLLVKTSQSHALGTHAASPLATAMPAIRGPLYLPAEDGKITPQYALWPAFWGLKNGQEIKPLTLPQMAALKDELSPSDSTLPGRSWPRDDADVILALAALKNQLPAGGEPVYVGGGLVTTLREQGTLSTFESPASEPYTWPMGHATRPARQALGAGGCGDCHASSAPFVHGTVEAASMGYPPRGMLRPMRAMRSVSGVYTLLLEGLIFMRPGLKFVLILGVVFLSALVLMVLLNLLGRILSSFAPEEGEQ